MADLANKMVLETIKKNVSVEDFERIHELLGMEKRYRFHWLLNNPGKWKFEELKRLAKLLDMDVISLVVEYGLGTQELSFIQVHNAATVAGFQLTLEQHAA